MGKKSKRKKRLQRIAAERANAQSCGCDCHSDRWPLETRYKPCDTCRLSHTRLKANMPVIDAGLTPSERYQAQGIHSHAEPNPTAHDYNRCSACHALIDPSAIACPYCMTIQPEPKHIPAAPQSPAIMCQCGHRAIDHDNGNECDLCHCVKFAYSQALSTVRQGVSTAYAQYSFAPKCDGHIPTLLLTTPEFDLYAGTKVKSNFSKFDVVLNLSGWTSKSAHVFPPGYEHLNQYSPNSTEAEIQLDWADMGASPVEPEFWHAFADTLRVESQKKGKKLNVLVCCLGGHGRTGTAVGCLLASEAGFTQTRALNFIHSHYCTEAVETKNQEADIAEVSNLYENTDATDISVKPDTPESEAK